MKVKNFFTNLWNISKAMFVGVIRTALIIILAIVLIDFMVFLFGNALMVSAVWVGITVVLSVVFIFFGLSPDTQSKIVKFAALHGVVVDLAITMALTYVAFMILGSVTMALVAMFVGFHVTAVCALCRVLWFIKHPEDIPQPKEDKPFAPVWEYQRAIEMRQGVDGSWEAASVV